ncbi:restriction endonuclease subunit S, partial [Holdemanella sp.]|uniref:restriction endonuclease subunit S n=2 Tax=Holdemanella TaxID=1573535 RepID=UPI003AF0EE77
SISYDEFLTMDFVYPTQDEQTKIANYLDTLDNLITLHQRKYDQLLNIKKSMLEKMFPKNGKKAPEIRFDGFTDDWEQRKLDEILIQRVEHQTISDDAPLLAFSYAEGVINPEDKKTNKRDFIMTDKFSKIFSRTEFNDIIYNPANVIHGAIHRNKLGTGVVSPIYKIFICNGVSPKYMGERLHTEKFIQEITKYIEGTVIKLRTLSPEKFLEMMVEVPNSYEEQEKIGEYFEKLDQLITLHQRKYNKLLNVKKSMLEKMFPKNGSNIPEIRFKGFTDPWEQRKWIDTVDISTEMVDPTSGEFDDMPHIAPGNIESFTGRILDNVKSVKEEQLISGKFRFRPGDVVYGKINPQLGKYFYASVDGLTSADAYVFNGKNGISQKFLFSLLQTADFFKYSVSVSKRSGMPKINRDELNAYSFLAPNAEEQNKIGDFLLELDHLITLHQRELEKLQNIKKSMLEKMFVSEEKRK